jgi:hypothetical protein
MTVAGFIPRTESNHYHQSSFFLTKKRFCLPTLLALKISTTTRILAHVNIECLDDFYPKLKIYISGLILRMDNFATSQEYIIYERSSVSFKKNA